MPSQPAPAQPNWDALANSFASLSLAFTVGSIILGVIAVISAIGWGYVVTVRAEKEARKEASECAKVLMDKWLAEEAPKIVRQHVDNLQNASLGATNDAEAADEMGKEAG
jgi:hypothetical protein